MKPKHKVLFNADDCWPIDQAPEPIKPEGVYRVVDNVADGGADVFLVCPNAHKVNYPSKVRETYWEELPEDYTKLVVGDPNIGDQKNIFNILVKMLQLSKQCDYLEMMLNRCREKGLVPGVSIRMNDMHDAQYAPNCWEFSKFYKEHPEYWIKDKNGNNCAALGLDYEHYEVRQHYLDLIEEIVNGYDLEILELDFLRFTKYFDDSMDFEKHCQIMTDFIEAVSLLIRNTGKHIHLMPRVAATPAGAYELGFDVKTWADKKLIDGLSIGNFLTTGWEYPVDEYRQLVGSDIAIYVYADHSAAYMDGLVPPVYIHISREHQRGFASGSLAMGADGIGTFNWYWGDNYKMSAQDYHSGLGEMSSLEMMRPKARRHMLSTAGWGYVSKSDLPSQVPIILKAQSSRQFFMVLAAETPGSGVTAKVFFEGYAKLEELYLRVNDRPLGYAYEITDGPRNDWAGKPYPIEKEPRRKDRIAHFTVPNGIIKDGRNILVVRSERTENEITILGIEIKIE